ncbi:MAG: hypothetical protein HY852_13945 [Bradyrhizobium sp.]|uniref:hypothetical protein n=1 Tax=Bradyrhizobium sp. TaxID=376 RepID=UPI0025B82ADE|nr:hypothetical protein [Bradyrhizobium sp.]MBI5262911.1 hypothetical protein [Bradyrhizobium sp.]
MLNNSTSFNRAQFNCGIWLVIALTTLFLAANPAVAQRCIVIDTDAALDDYRAISPLSKKHIAAILVTEGIAKGPEGASAISCASVHRQPSWCVAE